jgi:UDP-glucose 4-epimerase
VAGSGSLTISQIARRLGRPTVPIPKFATASLGQLLKRAGVADFTADQLSLLTYGRVIDTERMSSRLGLSPKYTTAAALTAHREAAGTRPLIPPGAVASAERRLSGLLAERAMAKREAASARTNSGWQEKEET